MDRQKMAMLAAGAAGLIWFLMRKGATDTSAAVLPITRTPSTSATGTGFSTTPINVTILQGGTPASAASVPDQTASNFLPSATPGASFGAGSAGVANVTSADEAEAIAAQDAYRAGLPAPAGFRYTPVGPVRI